MHSAASEPLIPFSYCTIFGLSINNDSNYRRACRLIQIGPDEYAVRLIIESSCLTHDDDSSVPRNDCPLRVMFCMLEPVPPRCRLCTNLPSSLTVETWVDIRSINAHSNP